MGKIFGNKAEEANYIFSVYDHTYNKKDFIDAITTTLSYEYSDAALFWELLERMSKEVAQ